MRSAPTSVLAGRMPRKRRPWTLATASQCRHVLNVDTGAHDILEACPEALQRAFDLVNHESCLSGRAYQCPVMNPPAIVMNAFLDSALSTGRIVPLLFLK